MKIEIALLLNFAKKIMLSSIAYIIRKKSWIVKKTVFHSINLKEEVTLEKKGIPQRENIGISISEINISMPSTEKELVVEVIKELSKIC